MSWLGQGRSGWCKGVGLRTDFTGKADWSLPPYTLLLPQNQAAEVSPLENGPWGKEAASSACLTLSWGAQKDRGRCGRQGLACPVPEPELRPLPPRRSTSTEQHFTVYKVLTSRVSY